MNGPISSEVTRSWGGNSIRQVFHLDHIFAHGVEE
jgi:hypothetical protein